MKLLAHIILLTLLANYSNAQWNIENINENAHHSGIIKFKNDSLGIWMKSNCSVIDGYDKGSSILKTIDSGETWIEKPVNINFNFYDFQFGRDSIIWAICFTAPYSDNARSILLKSPDLGESWDSIATFSRKSISTLYFFNLDTGLVAGSDIILRTVDQGKTWETISLKEYNYKNIVKSCFPNENTGFAIGVGGSEPGKAYYYENILLKTDNQGVDWNLISKFDEKLTSLYFVNELTGYVGTNNNIIKKTTDGGYSWTDIEITSDRNNVVRSLQFLSDQIGFATGSMRELTGGPQIPNFFIAKTIDGGESWSSYDTTGIDLTDIYFINEDTGFVAGYYELIMKTNGVMNKLPEDYPWNLTIPDGLGKNETLQPVQKIYPNPSNGIVNIEIEKRNEVMFFELFNSAGQNILKIEPQIKNNTIRLDLTSYKNDMYLLKVTYYDRVDITKIIKQ